MGDSPGGPAARPGPAGTNDGNRPHRPKLELRGKITSWLMGATGAMAINLFSNTLGYRWLAAVVALTLVLAAANWIRGLDTRAWLPRRASWIFLTPAAGVAVGAAFSSRPVAGALTSAAVILTVGAVLRVTGLDTAGQLLGGAAVIGVGVALIGLGAAIVAGRHVPVGAAFIGSGVAGIGVGAAVLADRHVPYGAAVIGSGVALIALGAAVLADRQVLGGAAVIGSGVAA